METIRIKHEKKEVLQGGKLQRKRRKTEKGLKDNEEQQKDNCKEDKVQK